MAEKTRLILKQISEFWTTLSTPKRLALVLLTTGVLIGVLVLSVLGSRERYALLYSDLSTEDAAAIVEKLNKAQVPHRLEAAGTAIHVPEERVHSLRLELASSGLPRGGGVGFELFDRSQIGATEFEQHVNLRRALEGELSRSITAVEGVRSARVHLVLPERRLFVAKSESASASVVVRLDNPQAFGKKEVAGIVHLVAAAVPGLTRERVSVVSTEGVTLHRPDMSGGGVASGYSDVATETSRMLASQLENDVRSQLERVVGPGNADVRVNVSLNPAAKERMEEHYEPSKTALRSEHKVEESAAGEEAGVAGVPGARTNLPDAAEDGAAPSERAGQAGDGVFRRSQTRNWEVDRITQKEVTPAGAIERLSVAVLLNGRWVTKGKAEQFVPRSSEEVRELEALVKKAVGYSEARGDQIEVRAMKFAKLAEPAEPQLTEQPWWWQRHYQYLLLAGALVLMLLCILVWRSRSSKKLARKLELQQLRAIEMKGEDDSARAELEGANQQLRLPASSNGTQQDLRSYALQMATKDPATAAVVLRTWLHADSATEGASG